MPSDDVTQLLSGGGAPAAKFPTIGTTIKGTILHSEVQDQRDMEGNLKTFDNGDPMKQIVVTLQTDIRDPEIDDDDGRRRVFVKGGLFSAVREAIHNASAQTLEEGATLEIRYTGNGSPKQRGYSPPKQYAAAYTAPTQAGLDAVAQALGATQERASVGGYGYDEEPF